MTKKLADHNVDVWLVYTGWTGGPDGIGERFKIAYPRAVIRAAMCGALDDVEFRVDPVFGFAVPEKCPGIPSKIFNPPDTWEDKAAYDEKAQYLAGLFVEYFKEFADQAPAAVGAAGPMARQFGDVRASRDASRRTAVSLRDSRPPRMQRTRPARQRMAMSESSTREGTMIPTACRER